MTNVGMETQEPVYSGWSAVGLGFGLGVPAGALSGATYGAIVGAMVFPVMETVVGVIIGLGAVIGAVVGALIGAVSGALVAAVSYRAESGREVFSSLMVAVLLPMLCLVGLSQVVEVGYGLIGMLALVPLSLWSHSYVLRGLHGSAITRQFPNWYPTRWWVAVLASIGLAALNRAALLLLPLAFL